MALMTSLRKQTLALEGEHMIGNESLRVREEGTPKTIVAAGTHLLLNGPGWITSIKVEGGTLGNVTVYDAITAVGTPIIPATTPLQNQEMIGKPIRLYTGLTIVTAAATTLLVVFEAEQVRGLDGTRFVITPEYPALAYSSANASYECIGHDATYLYLTGGGATLSRMDSAGVVTAAKVFTDKYIMRVWKTNTAGKILALVQTGTGATATYDVYLSTDWGATFGASPVLVLGDANGAAGAQVPMVSCLQRGCCIAPKLGANTVLLGEYNVFTAASRVAGGENDRVRLMQSDNDGETWTAIATWNTDAANNNVRHIHAVKAHPDNTSIYILFGDEDAQAGILMWDGSTAWTDIVDVNLSHVDVTHAGFKALHSSQKYRAGDLMFVPDGVVWVVDCPTAGLAGIWRASFDLSNVQRIDHAIETYGHLMFLTADSDDYSYALSGMSTPATNRYLYLWSSRKPGHDWKCIGKFQMRAGTAGDLPTDMFFWNDKLWVSALWIGGQTRAFVALTENGQTTGETLTTYYGT